MASSARIDELRKKFEENPRRYFAPLANEYRKAGDVEQAIAICREYLPQQPGHMSGHIVYGQALYEARQFEEGKTVFETALALDPENLIALRHLGDIALILGDTVGARAWYGRVLEADPRNEEIQAQLKSLETIDGSTTPAVSMPAAAPPDAASPDTATPAAIEMIDLERPPSTPASSAATVVVSAMQPPAVERTVEQEAIRKPEVESLSSVPTTEIVLDQVPSPAIPDPQNLVQSIPDPLPEAAPVDRASGFEPTAATTPPPAATAPPAMIELEGPIGGPAEAPPIDSFTLEGLETTSMSPESAAVAPEAPRVPEFALDAAPEPPKPPELAHDALPEPAKTPEQDTGSDVLEIIPPPPDDDASPGTARPLVESQESAGAERTPAPVAESSPFVTETMAELYEQQGHRDEALRVYRALLNQRPDDGTLRGKVEALEGRQGPSIRELLSRIAARRPAPREAAPALPEAPAVAEQPKEPPPPAADAPAAEEARIQTPPAAAEAQRADTPTEIIPQATAGRTDALAAFLGATTNSPESESAALVLAAAFSFAGRNGGGASDGSAIPGAPARPASQDLSLDAVFGAGEPAKPQPSSFSFDQFFSERATSEPGGAGSSATGGQESRDDIAKFTQWLEGLKQR